MIFSGPPCEVGGGWGSAFVGVQGLGTVAQGVEGNVLRKSHRGKTTRREGWAMGAKFPPVGLAPVDLRRFSRIGKI